MAKTIPIEMRERIIKCCFEEKYTSAQAAKRFM
jgi:hypothetical protein